MRQDLDQAMANYTLSQEKKARILEAAETGKQPYRPRRGRLPLAVLAACVVLAVSALAVSPSLRDALSAHLGGFEPYTSVQDGEYTCTDQGVQVRLVSTLADQMGGIAYLELTDLEGDRFDENMPCISYDPETHTALVEKRIALHWEDESSLAYGGGQDLGEDREYTLRLTRIPTAPEIRVEGITLPEDAVLDRTLESMPLGEGGRPSIHSEQPVLVPNQTPMELEGTDLFTISSVGFDAGGAFHIQLALADGVYFNTGTIFGHVSGATEELVSYSGNVLEGGRYIDLYYEDLEFANPSDVRVDELSAVLYTKPDVEGEWELTFPLEILPERVVSMDETISGMPGLTIRSMTFSVVGARLEGVTQGLRNGGTLVNQPAWIYLEDGSAVKLENGSGLWSRTENGAEDTGYFTGEYSLDTPVEPEEIVGVSLGYWMIPIQGETGGPGYWLTELPE